MTHDQAAPYGEAAEAAPAPARERGPYRVEHDSMGEVAVPAAALWQAQTQRAVENFPISGLRLDRAHIAALGLVKACAARANGRLGVLEPELAQAIAAEAERVAAGGFDEHFPVDVFQTGSGTSSNMNTNEVVATLTARRLGRPVHPNDHVNASQSSNDVFPTSIRLAAGLAVTGDLLPALRRLQAMLAEKAVEFHRVVKAGRTHLMDATPVTLGQEFGGYATQVGTAAARVESVLARLGELPLGGTAVGTGVNAPPGFAAAVIAELAERTGLPLVEAPDHFAVQAGQDALVELSGQLRAAAVTLTKIANDIRWMASGPRAGLGEIRLPDLQPGSSIMPGKVNPVLCEAVVMVAAQVTGNDTAVAVAGAGGSFELTTTLPVMAHNLLESVRLLARVSVLFADRCVSGITADADRCREYAESSPAIVTPLSRRLGYEEAAAIAKQAQERRTTIRQAVVDRGRLADGTLTAEQLDDALDVARMAGLDDEGRDEGR